MSDFENPLYVIVNSSDSKESVQEEIKKTKPTPAPRPSIQRKQSSIKNQSLSGYVPLTIPENPEPQVVSEQWQDEDTYDVLTNVNANRPPPSYPPPKPPRKSSKSDYDDVEKLDFETLDIESTCFKKDDNENVQLDTRIQAPSVIEFGVPGYVNTPEHRSISLVPSSPPPPLPPRKASLEAGPPRTPERNVSQDDRIKDGLSRTDSTKSESALVKSQIGRSTTNPIEIPSRTSMGSVESHHSMSSSDCPSSEVDTRSTSDTLSEVKAFVTSNSSYTSKHGYLYKSAPDRKSLLKRWFTLDSNALSYYKDEPVFTNGIPRPRSSPSGVIYTKDIVTLSISLSPPLFVDTGSALRRPWGSFRHHSSLSNNLGSKLWYFEVGVNCASKSKFNGRQYLMAADNEEDGRSWLKALALSIAPRLSIGLSCDPFQVAAFVKVKHGVTGYWTNGWVTLSDRQIHLVVDPMSRQVHKRFDIPNSVIKFNSEEDEIISVDLRKVKCLSYTPVGSPSKSSNSDGNQQPIIISRQNDTSLYLQTEVPGHSDLLYQLILKDWMVPVAGALKEQYLTLDNVPVAINDCLNFVSTYGGLTTKGIYRLSGHMSVVRSIFESLKSSKKIWELHMKPEDGITVHDVVSALKMYLRSFSECLLTEAALSMLITNFGNVAQDAEARREKTKYILMDMPTVNYSTLKKLIGHLCCVVANADTNEMALSNIAPVLAPTIIYSNNENYTTDLTDLAIRIVSELISNYTWYFDVSPEEIDREKKIQDKISQLRDSKILPKSAGDLLVPVYVYNRQWGQCINVKLTPTMTANDLVHYIIRAAKLADKTAQELSLFEVVCNEQLERVIHWTEVVLGTSLSWAANWSPDDAEKNYLLVKDNKELFGKIRPFLSQSPAEGGLNTTSATMLRSSTVPFTLFSELKFSGIDWGKTFKKVLFEFTGAKLNVYKDARASKVLGEWNIENITWYIGSEKKRCPPTEYAFTFFDRGQKVERRKDGGYFVGRTVCCSTQDEFYKWIAGMTITEYNQGLTPPASHLIDLLS